MNKKKISLIIAAGVVVTALVGGSLAWFTSNDTVTNKFTTGSINHEIVEDFEEGLAQDLLPGDEVKKEVFIKNTGKSDALLRVKITQVWKEKSGVTEVADSNAIELVFEDGVKLINGTVIGPGGTDINWIEANDGYFYYTKVFTAMTGELQTETEKLLKAVRLSGQVSDQSIYADREMEVIIESETVQVNADAYRDEWGIVVESEDQVSKPEASIINMLDSLVNEYKQDNNKTHAIQKKPLE